MGSTYSNGSWVGIERAMCPVCGKTHTPTGAAVFLHTRFSKVFPPSGHAKPTRYALCEEHQKLYNDGYVAVVGCDEDRSAHKGDRCQMEDAYRTGRVAHIRASAWAKLFDTTLPVDKDGKALPMVFADDRVLDFLQRVQEQAEVS